MSKFHLIDRDIDFLLPPSVQEWLPEGHLRNVSMILRHQRS